MALLQLTEEQVRSWTRAQKDEWWLKHVFRGDMPQLTLAFGGHRIPARRRARRHRDVHRRQDRHQHRRRADLGDPRLAIYRLMAKAGFARDFTILEKQLHAVDRHGGRLHDRADDLQPRRLHAGHREDHPWWHMVVWMCVVSVIGVLLAFPMKRRFINDEQLPFSGGTRQRRGARCAVHRAASAGMYKARLLAGSALRPGCTRRSSATAG